MAGLDEDAIDEVLYLARANEPSELDSYVSELSTQTKRSKAELFAAATDPYSKNSALHYAAANGHNDIIKLLFSTSAEKPEPAFLNAVNDAGNTPLHWAALNGHLESVKLLVQSGADVTIINRAGHDAVYEAEINDKNEVVDWLLGAVEELENGIGQNGQTGAGDADDNMDDADAEVECAQDSNASAQGVAAEPTVEGVRKQMADMSTQDVVSKGG
ncbi:ankyrin repeat-containing protein YAR1 [Alternaria rosae]|uniref:ankyrin repeat-containing protein YAR1 n=1 Tax=Alternaria rosae TaxID=1187941 RepID=UPI001E8D9097|nr:ankyrin repeat-containing protein YAR1 [Alternaria rosae]KAH6882408.1 ankyrin repeat-containing protein YAR1 [Alternaria rosae]